MEWEGNVAENWKKWHQELKIYFTATGIAAKTDDVKIASLLHIGGEQCIAVHNSFKWNETGDTEGDAEKYAKIVNKLKVL